RTCLLVLTGAGLLLGGCGRQRAAEQPSLPELPEQFATATPNAGTNATIGWLQQFADPALEALVQEALAANHDLAAAAARLEASWAEARLAGADRYPQINATGSATRNRSAPTAFTPNGTQTNSFQVG